MMYNCVSHFRYEYVWDETNRFYNEMLHSEGWPTINTNSNSGKTIELPVVQDITTRIALSIVLSAGFGLKLSWNDTSPSPTASQSQMDGQANGTGGGKLRLSDGVKLQADNVVLVAEAPFMLKLPIKK